MKLETRRDREREDAVADSVAATFKCDHVKLAEYARVDRYFTRDKKIVGVVEIKVRANRKFGDFDTAFLNLDKAFVLLQAEMAMGIPGIFVLAFIDGVYYVRVGTLLIRDMKLSNRGRVDRAGVVNDVRPVIEIPISEFKFVCESPTQNAE